jgi:hypothetical protein
VRRDDEGTDATMLNLVATSDPGDHLQDAIAEGIALSRKLGVCVSVKFNGVLVRCRGNSDPKALNEQYESDQQWESEQRQRAEIRRATIRMAD